MNQMLRFYIGYPSGQDGTILLPRYFPLCPARRKHLLSTARLLERGRDIGLVLRVFSFGEFMNLNSVSVHKHTEKNWTTSSHLDRALGIGRERNSRAMLNGHCSFHSIEPEMNFIILTGDISVVDINQTSPAALCVFVWLEPSMI